MCGPVVTKPRSAPCPEGTRGRADAGNGGELVWGNPKENTQSAVSSLDLFSFISQELRV